MRAGLQKPLLAAEAFIEFSNSASFYTESGIVASE